MAALAGLAELGVAVASDQGWRVDRKVLWETAAFRRGAREALALASRQRPTSDARLCVALPTDIDSWAERDIRTSAVDLRAGLLNVIAMASEELILASPFWDEPVAEELSDLLRRRVDTGVSVTILARSRQQCKQAMNVLRNAIFPRETAIKVFHWHHPSATDPFGSQTFHFKCAVADRGTLAYLGSANFTQAGLRSRMEMGMLLSGNSAAQVHSVLASVLRIARTE